MTFTSAVTAIRNLPRPGPPVIVAGFAFLVAFWRPMVTLGSDWWNDPEAGHGLLLFPVALWLMYKRGVVEARPQRALGMTLLIGAVLLRYGSGLAAELFTMRASLVGAAMALVIYGRGFRQLLHWWLPVTLIILSIPLPAVILSTLALPLQLRASEWGAAMLDARHVPVRLDGNVISLPGRSLFVTEACSGLRSLTALLSLGVLIGGLWLKSPWSRILLLLAAIPVAVVLNAIRVFLTGFIVYFISPALAEGFMHYSEGWAMFVIAFAILGMMAWVLVGLEGFIRRKRKAT